MVGCWSVWRKNTVASVSVAYKRIWPCTECDSCKEGTPFKNRLKTRLLVRFSGSTDSMWSENQSIIAVELGGMGPLLLVLCSCLWSVAAWAITLSATMAITWQLLILEWYRLGHQCKKGFGRRIPYVFDNLLSILVLHRRLPPRKQMVLQKIVGKDIGVNFSCWHWLLPNSSYRSVSAQLLKLK